VTEVIFGSQTRSKPSRKPFKKAQGALVEGIEAQFKKLGQNMFWSYVVNFGWICT
jgi:hypothetical protein